MMPVARNPRSAAGPNAERVPHNGNTDQPNRGKAGLTSTCGVVSILHLFNSRVLHRINVLSVRANRLLSSRAPFCCVLGCPQATLLPRLSHVPRRSAGIESALNWTRCGRGLRSPCKAQDQPAVGSRDIDK